MSKAGRVCMVVHHFFPRDVRVRREARALAQAGYEVSVVCLKQPGQPERERWQDIEVIRRPVRRYRGSPLPVYLAEYLAMSGLSLAALVRLHHRRPLDVVHVHSPPDFLIAAGAPVRLGGARLVLDVHDLSPELYASRFGGLGSRAAQWLLGQVEQGACALADRVITVTDVFKRRLVSRGVGPDKVLVLHNCPDEQLFSPAPGQPERTGGSPLRIVHHGTLVHRYGVDALLDAFEAVLAQLPDARLDIYGEGDLLPKLERQAARAPLRGRVWLHGDVPQERLVAALNTADLCVVPNRSDPFTDMLLPTKLLEALRMGRATIASNTPVIRETFPNGEVRLVPPGDPRALSAAILALGRDETARRHLAERGRKVSARFSWKKEKEKLLGLYADLVA